MRKTNGLWAVVAFAALMVISVLVAAGVGHKARASETALVQRSVRAAALTCYAVEGAYPAQLQYLKDHYGLTYDEAVYNVRYDAFASNILPDIYVTEGGGVE